MRLQLNGDTLGRTVTAEQALLTFLQGSLGSRRERIVDFVRRAKTHRKFLELLYHQLGGLFRESSVVAQLPNAAWSQPALRFKPGERFGVPVASLRDAHAEGGQAELVITADARFGYWRDETYVDSEILVMAAQSGPNDPNA